jgi:cytochrome oxidase Cu insertion factor (SCO1/SenC/PrrC family)
MRVDLRHVVLLAALAAITTPVAAQSSRLGPVDGRGLPAVDTGRVRVGAAAPDFTLESMTGDTVTLSQYRGQKHVILVFYRGHW